MNIQELQQIEINGKIVELMHADYTQSGYGHKKITIQLVYGDATSYFIATTNNMPAFDAAMDLEDYDEKTRAIYNIIAHQIEEQIIEWVNKIDEKNA